MLQHKLKNTLVPWWKEKLGSPKVKFRGTQQTKLDTISRLQGDVRTVLEMT